MTTGGLVKWIIILCIVGVGVYFGWEPTRDFFSSINPANPKADDNVAKKLGGGVGQGINGFTGATQVDALQRTKSKVTDVDLKYIRDGIEIYRLDHNGAMPTSLEDLTKSGALSPGQALKDPWGTPFDSQLTNGKFYVISAGPDRVKGTTDDQTIDMSASPSAP